ncbi:MAG: penicillin-binding protein activator [candidate division KSB1 bacterium]|nr:penicillin-binding protein activator [candidate division KSB1 bacterium]
MKPVWILLIGFGCLLPSAALAQQRPEIRQVPEVQQRFEQGVILYNNGNFREAEQVFRELIKARPMHQLITASLIMHARCSYWLKDYETVTQDIKQLLLIHPQSRYIADAHMLMGLVHFQNGDVYKAAKQFLLAQRYARSPVLSEKVVRLARILLSDYLPLEQLQQLKTEPVGSDGQALIVLAEAEQYLRANDPQKAKSITENFLSIHAEGKFVDELRAFLKDRVQRILNINRIGVVLPLTGEFAEEGRRIVTGIKFAEQEIRRKNAENINVETVIRDSGSNMILTVKAAQELVSDPNVVCLVGELENLITAGLAGMAQAYRMPMLTTNATDIGIAGIGESIFQTSPDLQVQARAMARYAFFEDSLRTFVTIAPHDEYGSQMVDAFSEEIDRLGGEIITQRWYYGVPENLGRQFKEIREIAFRRVFLDTIRPQLPNFAALDKDSLWNDFLERVKAETHQDETIVEQSAAYPVTNIDAVFLPIYTEDIEYVARQLKYFNINAKILGGEYWYLTDLDRKKTLLRYVDGATFVSSYYFDPESFEYKNFRNRFRKATGSTPERWELIGFDIGSFVFSLLDASKISRQDMQMRLLQSRPFLGRKGEIRFDLQTRVNQFVHILRIQGPKIIKLPFDGEQYTGSTGSE